MSEEIKKDWQKIKEAATDDNAELDVDNAAKGILDHPSYLELLEKLTVAEQQAHDNWEKSVRAIAELDNVRRRSERDITNAHRYGLERFVTVLLPVIDSLEQAIALVDAATHGSMHEGMALTMKLFIDALAKFDVRQLDPVGEVFDPNQHEAMSMQEAAGVAANTIIAVFQKGYVLNDRVIRPARVIVAK